MHVLAIETSCDETSAAVVRDDLAVLSNIVLSQDEIHAPYGGVVPELASRQHLKSIVPIVRESLAVAGIPRSAAVAFDRSFLRKDGSIVTKHFFELVICGL